MGPIRLRPSISGWDSSILSDNLRHASPLLAEAQCLREAREALVQALDEALAQGVSREEIVALVEDRVRIQWQAWSSIPIDRLRHLGERS